jgi:hypothetical protein
MFIIFWKSFLTGSLPAMLKSNIVRKVKACVCEKHSLIVQIVIGVFYLFVGLGVDLQGPLTDTHTLPHAPPLKCGSIFSADLDTCNFIMSVGVSHKMARPLKIAMGARSSWGLRANTSNQPSIV